MSTTTDKTTTMQKRAKTVKESLEDLTGYDELAIAEAFGEDVYALGGSTRLRALLWMEKRKDPDVSDGQAHAAVMAMRSADVADSFGNEDDEEDEDAGKDATTASKPPTS